MPQTEMAASKEKDANTTVIAGLGGEIAFMHFTNAKQERLKIIKKVSKLECL